MKATMLQLKRVVRASLYAWVVFGAALANAQWELDSTQSDLRFISIKNNAVGEVHSFGAMKGQIGEAGDASVTIDLDSVETLIDIRNERMRQMLFNTVDFPVATVSADVDRAVLDAAAAGGVANIELPLGLSLHGVEATLNAPLVVLGEGDGRIRVFSARPLLVNAADFGLEAGVEALRNVAGLNAISTSVPVTLHLLFVPAGQ